MLIPTAAFGDEIKLENKNDEKALEIFQKRMEKAEQLKVIYEERCAQVKEKKRIEDIINRAYSQLGKPYSWGACGPRSFDCSGFVSYCVSGEYKRLGTTNTFMSWARTEEPQPGDICTTYNHCGIYIGNNQMIHAPHSGDVVKISPVQSGMIFVHYKEC